MTSRRLQRVNEQLKREISRILRREVHDPRVGLVLVTGVDVSGDLSVADVYVRPTGAEKDWPDMMEGLEAAAAFVRRELAQDLELRKVPELRFREDHTLEKAMRIEQILSEVLPEDSPSSESADRSSSSDTSEDSEVPEASDALDDSDAPDVSTGSGRDAS